MTRLVRALLLALIIVTAAISPLTGLALVMRESITPPVPPQEKTVPNTPLNWVELLKNLI